MNEILEQKIQELPRAPGVYIMMDKEGTIIYIGKAKILKNRVSQYFLNLSAHTTKVEAMVSNIADFRYIITNSEIDALSLEATLIRKHRPYYNILLKDDKAHPYIRIDLKLEYPALEVTRKLRFDGAKYFGPYFGGVNVRDVIDIAKSAFQVRACRGNTWAKSHRVCLDYHIGICSGACEKRIRVSEYRAQLERAMNFLNGNDVEVERLLQERMKLAATAQNYEQAMVYRDRLNMLSELGRRILANLTRDANFDVFGYATNATHAAVTVEIIRGGKTIAAENFPIVDAELTAEECLSEFLLQYYDGSRMLPTEVVLESASEAMSAVKEYLSVKYGHAVIVTVPERGTKRKLVENAQTNARDFITKSVDRVARAEERTFGAVAGLQHLIGMAHPPRRMECYDISNISGTDKVSSMVVFVDGEADRASYRRFKIKTVEGSNDFACMKETLVRRLKHLDGDALESDRFGAPPDLIVVDGGKGQLSYALDAMREAGHDFPLIALAERFEEIYVPGREAPIVLQRDSYVLQLVQRIRDEAHRFAVTFHRALRANRYVGRLEEIPYIGKEKRIALIAHFKSAENISKASVEELCKVDGIGIKRATAIQEWFKTHGEKE